MKWFKRVSLEDELVNLRIVSKQMQRSAKKSEKNQKQAQDKVVKAIKQNNPEGARIYAQDAIREKNSGLNSLRMASRIDACSSRIETAVRMGEVTKGMEGVVKGMSKGMASMNVDKISRIMDKFEQQFEDLDVKTQYMEGTMDSTTATSTPVGQVDELISQVAAVQGLELGDEFTKAGLVSPTAPVVQQEGPVSNDLSARLEGLK